MDESSGTYQRRLPIGSEPVPDGGVHFRVWAPERRQVVVEIQPREGHAATPSASLQPEGNGYFSGLVADAGAGTLYGFRLDGQREILPDPASRFQPYGPHGASMVIDPRRFRWGDAGWQGVRREGQVLYELHVGTFTPAGTWDAATRELEELADAGLTVIEVMPVAEFAGEFGWGYDGVDLFAPSHLYGHPDDFRRFVDRAHALGLGVILDVVYNHLGPDGNYLRAYAPYYFTDRYENEWGDALDFDGPHSGSVREFFITNAGYWIDEFHVDGLRLDATQSIVDDSDEHVIAAIGRRARERAHGRRILLVAENEPQDVVHVRSIEEGGYGLDALWNDDFHHSAMVAMTGRREAYYSDHAGAPQEFIAAAKWGYLYQGQWYRWQRRRRGTPTFGLEPAMFVNYIQNHDQVANSAGGARAHTLTSPARYRAMTALMLLLPGTPMLFQGQEFCASAPFLYFADHRDPALAAAVRQGRAEFLAQFRSIATDEMRGSLPDPSDRPTFERCKLDLTERERHGPLYRLHKDLLRLRREDPVFRAQRAGGVDGAVLGPEAFVLRYFGPAHDDRLLIVNLGTELQLATVPEPLLAAPEGRRWAVQWYSEHPCYGGTGTAALETDRGWHLPGHAAVVLAPTQVVLAGP